MSCKRKEKNSKEKLEAQNRAVIGHYAQNLAQEHNQKNKKKGQMVTNLDDFPDPEQTSPMLDGQDSNNSDRVSRTQVLREIIFGDPKNYYFDNFLS